MSKRRHLDRINWCRAKFSLPLNVRQIRWKIFAFERAQNIADGGNRCHILYFHPRFPKRVVTTAPVVGASFGGSSSANTTRGSAMISPSGWLQASSASSRTLREKVHKPRNKVIRSAPGKRVNLLVYIRAKLRAGKGIGYERWARIFNHKHGIQQIRDIFYFSIDNNL